MLSGQIYAAENEDLQFSADADVYEDDAFDFEDETAARLLAGDNAEKPDEFLEEDGLLSADDSLDSDVFLVMSDDIELLFGSDDVIAEDEDLPEIADDVFENSTKDAESVLPEEVVDNISLLSGLTPDSAQTAKEKMK